MSNSTEPSNKIPVSIGDRFGNLTIINEIINKKDYNRKFLCKCDCGKETIVYFMKLRSGRTKSCGCYRKQKAKETLTTHGLSNHRLYRTWNSMMQRCNNPNNSEYINYGGRGIAVCDEWEDIRKFIEDMDGTYQKELSIDRIDNSKGYSKYNCRWSTNKEQSNNTRRNRIVTYNNKNYTLAELCKKCNIDYDLVRSRLEYGIEIHDAIKNESLLKIKITQMDLHGNDIQEFDSIEDAVRKTGILHSGISRTISGEQTQSGGFKWKKA